MLVVLVGTTHWPLCCIWNWLHSVMHPVRLTRSCNCSPTKPPYFDTHVAHNCPRWKPCFWRCVLSGQHTVQQVHHATCPTRHATSWSRHAINIEMATTPCLSVSVHDYIIHHWCSKIQDTDKRSASQLILRSLVELHTIGVCVGLLALWM